MVTLVFMALFITGLVIGVSDTYLDLSPIEKPLAEFSLYVCSG